jgi:predicted phage-related endonuclease
MKITKYDDKDAWILARRGKITGTRLKDIIVKRGTGKKIGFYELIAERLGIPADGEDAMARGLRLESEAMARFEKETGKKVNQDLVIWSRDDDVNIAISPDGYIGKKEAVEVKCLSSARHIQAIIENKIPDDYEYQVLQYFIVNDDLNTLHFVMYDPRIIAKDFVMFQVHRKDVQKDVDTYLALERETLSEVIAWTEKLSDF